MAEHAFDCWEGIKSLIVSQCESNLHQLEVSFGQLSMRASEDVATFVGRVEEMRRMLTFASVVKTDLSVKQTILKGLPQEFAPVSTSYLHESDASSLESVSVMELLGRLRVFESSLDKPKPRIPGANSATEKGKDVRTCSYYGKPGHVARQCFKRKRDAKNDKTPSSDRMKHDKNQTSDRAMHVACQTSADYGMNAWIVDSGASSHMASDPSLFTEMTPRTDYVKYTDGSQGRIEGVGTVFVIFNGFAITLYHVLCVPSLTSNRFSVTAAASKGNEIIFSASDCSFLFSDQESFSVPKDPQSVLVTLIDTLKREPVVSEQAYSTQSHVD